MKRTLLLFMAFLLTGVAFGQENEPTGKNILKLSADGLFLDRYQLSYERIVGKFTSVQLTAGVFFDYLKTENADDELLNLERTNGFILAPEFRVYLSDFTNQTPPEGAFFALVGRYATKSIEEEFRDPFIYNYSLQDVRNVGIGITAGFQYITDFGLGFDCFLGPEFRYEFRDSQQINRTIGFPELDDESKTSVVEKIAAPIAGVNVSYCF